MGRLRMWLDKKFLGRGVRYDEWPYLPADEMLETVDFQTRRGRDGTI
jgi:hypothetical protein